MSVVVLSNCTIQKRAHRSGYYVEWNKKKSNIRPDAKNDAAISMLNVKQEITPDTNKKGLLVSLNNSIDLKSQHNTNSKLRSTLSDTCGDFITLKDGIVIEGKILEITETEVKYKKCNNLSGPAYKTKLEKIASIKYANGTEEIIGQGKVKKLNSTNSEPIAQPNNINQNTDHINKNARLSFIFGALTFPLFALIFPGPLALYFGLKAWKEVKNGGGRSDKRKAIFGIVMGLVYIIIIALVIIF